MKSLINRPVLGIARKLGRIWHEICCTPDEFLKISIYLDGLRRSDVV